jgi:Domain of unknown function (DUF5615)
LRASFLADADLRFAIVQGLRRLDPRVDFLPAQRSIPDSTGDSDVLALAADLDRVLVSHDLRTVPGRLYRFLRNRESPGVILIPQILPTGDAVEELSIAWNCLDADEFRNRIIYLPL